MKADFKVIAIAKDTTNFLVEDNMGLVRAVVSKFFRGSGIEDSELYSAGCVGLVAAARTFDASKSKFSTWATRIITQHVINELRRNKADKSVPLSSLEQSDADAVLEDRRSSDLPLHLMKFVTNEDSSETKSESENRRILMDCFLGERSFSEIGRELGISREAVRKRAQKAIERIRIKNSEVFGEYMA